MLSDVCDLQLLFVYYSKKAEVVGYRYRQLATSKVKGYLDVDELLAGLSPTNWLSIELAVGYSRRPRPCGTS